MGCCGTKVDHATSANFMATYRSKGGGAFQTLVMGIKDQNMTGKTYLSGPGSADEAFRATVTAALSRTEKFVKLRKGGGEYDEMWDVAWHNTKLTSGMQAFSMTKPYFPRGKTVVALLDACAQHGWVPTAAPNFGGPISDKASADWPSIIFNREDGTYTQETLFMAVKDQNVPGKLCVAGPAEVVGKLSGLLLERLKKFSREVKHAFDSYDTEQDWDAVFLNTSITSGHAAFSMAKPYFPKGNVVMSILEETYTLGWRLVAAPNFGGNDVDWPCFIFRKLTNPPVSPPQLVMGAIKDQNMPGKVCFAGAGAAEAAARVLQALQQKAHQRSAKVEKDSYDDDWDAVIRGTEMTTGASLGSAFGLQYFPRNDSMMAMLGAMNEAGWNMAGCPNFGGFGASWPTFLWEKRDEPARSAFVAIKDQNVPGKVCVGGVGNDPGLSEALQRGLDALATTQVVAAKDSWDKGFDMAFRGTAMTTGSTPFSMQNAWFPFGFPLELVVTEMGRRGWKVVGGPNFGAGKLSWSALVFESAGAAPAQQAMAPSVVQVVPTVPTVVGSADA
mmetsp:Transcript_37503/g.97008  ORF Transcript_37503/g.97008 Transcript_37503/m.97008 type:complete len:558 (-) Transcript_37503:624-2297(-)